MPITAPSALRLPARPTSATTILARRLALAAALIAFVAAVAYLGRDGYRDGDDMGAVTLLDALYYASVSVTTTGYGDITPVTDGTRLATLLLITPARIMFLILLVGTTVEVLAESSREAYRRTVWRRRRLKDHTIVCGYGTKGRNAVATLVASGESPESIVIVDTDPDVIEEATRAGFAAVHGRSTRTAVLEEAGVRTAARIVVATDTDEASVLTTLTAREHNPDATIVAAVREAENRHLIHESGANSAIVSSGTAGRLLGLATDSPTVVEVLEDLMTVGTGMDILERDVTPEQVGRSLGELHLAAPVIAVVRGGRTLRFDDPAAQTLQAGDRVVCLCGHDEAPPA